MSEEPPKEVPQLPIYKKPEMVKPGMLGKMMSKMMKLPKMKTPQAPRRRKKGDNLFY